MAIQAHLADPDYIEPLRQELHDIIAVYGNLIITTPQMRLPVFAQDTWLNPHYLDIASINDAATQLKPHSTFWAPYLNCYARRTTLIAEKLRAPKLPKTYAFPLAPLPPIAQFTLLEPNRLLFATQRAKAIPSGRFHFIEDKVGPPNRAYLKLWEALSILQVYPQHGDFALDIGASPGGWTYVLQQLGANVLAVDKAPLEPRIAKLPRVNVQSCSAFSLKPSDFEHIDWLVCDMACYPDKLYNWLMPWIESGIVTHFIITIKLQGNRDIESIRPFQDIAHARVLHLQHNKHEVTLLLD